MVEGEESGWLSELEKKGLHQVVEILENYGINSETDVSVIDRDDFCKLASRGYVQYASLSPWNHMPMEHQLQLL